MRDIREGRERGVSVDGDEEVYWRTSRLCEKVAPAEFKSEHVFDAHVARAAPPAHAPLR